MSQVAVHLSDEQADRIEAIARYRHASAADVIGEAVTNYLDYDAEFRAAVREGVAQADRGDTEDFEPFAAELRARMAARVAASSE